MIGAFLSLVVDSSSKTCQGCCAMRESKPRQGETGWHAHRGDILLIGLLTALVGWSSLVVVVASYPLNELRQRERSSGSASPAVLLVPHFISGGLSCRRSDGNL